jgi:hypothetical protein
MNALLSYDYAGKMIEFADDAFVNITSMCAAFGKKPFAFLRLESTERYIEALAADTGLLRESSAVKKDADALVITREGRHGSGTWVHPDLALECARWLSPAFSIWCNRVIRALLSGRIYNPAADSALVKKMETGIAQTTELLKAKKDRYWKTLEVPGNVSIKVYCRAVGLNLATKEVMQIGATIKARARGLGYDVGKTRQRRCRWQGDNPVEDHCGWQMVCTFPPAELHAECVRRGWVDPELPCPTPEAFEAVRRPLVIKAPYRLLNQAI